MKPSQEFEYGYRHGRQLSHFLVDVTAHGRDTLALSLAVACSDTIAGEKYATHFVADGPRQLTLFAGPPKPRPGPAAQAFPQPLSHPQATDFVWDWLQRVEYPPDEHDGSSRKGWRAFNEQFGIVDGCWEAFIAICPMWIYLPK